MAATSSRESGRRSGPAHEEALSPARGSRPVLVEGAIRSFDAGHRRLTPMASRSASDFRASGTTPWSGRRTDRRRRRRLRGLPGEPDDPAVAGIRAVAARPGETRGRRGFGSRGARRSDGGRTALATLSTPSRRCRCRGTTSAAVTPSPPASSRCGGRRRDVTVVVERGKRSAQRRPRGAVPSPTRRRCDGRDRARRRTPRRQRGGPEDPRARIAVSYSSRVISPRARRASSTARGPTAVAAPCSGRR